MDTIQLIARAIIIKDSKILLCKAKDRDLFFLPGGHIEFSETAERALAREILEELGTSCGKLEFLCSIENIFNENGKKQHEVNFLFKADPIEPFATIETHIEFAWIKLAELQTVNLKPTVLQTMIPQIQNITSKLFTHIDNV